MKYLYNLTEISTPITLSKVHQTTLTFTTNNITQVYAHNERSENNCHRNYQLICSK